MGTYVAFIGAEQCQIPFRVIFGGFWALTNTWARMTRKKLQNPPKIPLHGNCISSLPIKATNVPKVPSLRYLGQQSFNIKYVLKKNLVIVLDEVKVQV